MTVQRLAKGLLILLFATICEFAIASQLLQNAPF